MFRKSLLVVALILIAAVAFAQPAAPESPATPPTTLSAVPIQLTDVDAIRTRQELRELLRRHPPEVGSVMDLAPSLLTNEAYMTSYPALKAFVAAHPEVVANPQYFFDGLGRRNLDAPKTPSMDFWENVMGGFAALFVFSVVTGTIAWLIKTLLEQRRWSRVAAMQSDAHGKLLDRMASNEQLLTYIQTPAGRRFLESMPINVEGPRTMSVPVSRVLWSAQAGVVLAAAGIGFLIVSGEVPKDGDLALYVIGVTMLSVGIGFVVSSIAQFVLARRFGIWKPQGPLAESAAE